MSKTLIFYNLPEELKTKTEIRQYLREGGSGPIKKVEFTHNPKFILVTFRTNEEARRAMMLFNQIEGPIKVTFQ